MLQSLLFQGIGSVGFFSARAFMPAFVTALVLTYGPEMGFLGIDDSRFFENVEIAEIWFTSGFAVTLLGFLAILEFVVMHNPDLRALVSEFEVYVKPVMAIITFLGFFGAIEPEALVVAMRQAAVTDVLAAGVVGAGVFTVSSKRRDLMALFMEADEDDEVGIQKLFSWGEDLWVLFGPWFLLLFPLLTVFLIGIGIGLLYRARKRAEAREEQSKIPCGACGVPIFRSALACPSCSTETEAPRAVGYLGQAKANRAADPATHPYRLVEKKRCPVCATRFKKRKPRQTCTPCGHQLMADAAFSKAYAARIGRRVPLVLVVSFLLSLVPIIGLIPAVIYYRLELVAPFRRYVPRGRSLMLRWGTRVFYFVLIAFQWVPLLGGFVAPIMGFTSYQIYRSFYLRLLRKPPKAKS